MIGQPRVLIPLGVFLLLAAIFARGLFLDPRKLPSAMLGKTVPSFELPDVVGGKPLGAAAWGKRPVILVVWASWCAACVEEQPMLQDLAEQGVPLYGLNYKDTLTNARQFLAQYGNPFVKSGFDRDGKVAMNLGVYGAPELFLIDRDGVIRFRATGALHPDAKAELMAHYRSLTAGRTG